MKNKPYHVVGIGNAIVDVLSFAPESFIVEQGMTKGAMTLIDDARAESLYAAMGQAEECSGGSTANTLAGLASLGARTAFVGKVSDDQLGKIFRHDITAIGVEFTTPVGMSGLPTARCLISVTPDGQRTMNTYLGAAGEIFAADLDSAPIAKAQVLYVEGYLWYLPTTKETLKQAFSLAKEHGTKIAFTASDAFCVEGARSEFLHMIAHDFDILFCNEAEAKALYPGQDFQATLNALSKLCPLVAVTLGEKGSVILKGEERIHIEAMPVHKVVDTTGAGDLYAAGFLYGYTQGLPLEACGRLGSACAAEIITQLGARAQKPLKRLIA
jgi:sugar/nucleoside kinase (ribokinase family)